jgi:PAS domain S-box-containing protein
MHDKDDIVFPLSDVSPEDTRMELACGSVKMALLYLEENYGTSFTSKLLSATRMNRSYVENPRNWVSMEYYYRFLDEMVKQTGDPEAPMKTGAYAIRPDCFGTMSTLLVRLGTVRGTYYLLSKLYHFLGHTQIWKYKPTGPTSCIFSVHMSKLRQTKNNCMAIKGAMAQLPVLHGCPPAVIKHASCICDGAPACVYEISWIEKPAHIRALLGALIGSIVGLYAYVMGGGSMFFSVGAVGLTLIGYLGGRIFDYSVRLRESYAHSKEQSDSLEKSMKATEALNLALQQQVEERTEALNNANIELRERREHELAQQREATIGTLASGMAHELNTPLNTIQLGIQALRKSSAGESQDRQVLAAIWRASKRCSRIVGELLTFSREPQTVSVMSLRDVVLGALAVFESEKPSGIQIHHDVSQSVPVVHIDGAQIQQVLLNLFNNAADAMDENGVITVRMQEEKGQVVVEVSDNGPGIPREKQKSIFEPFESTKRDRGKGLGLGLSISAELVKKNHGEIDVESQLGQGACFSLRFPVSNLGLSGMPANKRTMTTSQDDLFKDRSAIEADDMQEANTAFSDNPIDMLLVEDDKDAGQMLRRMLAKHDIRVHHVTSGRQGLARFDTNRFDVVVSDVFLGDMTGLDLLHDIRKRDKIFPVILLTGHDSIASAIDALHYGAQDYIRKPLENIEDLSNPVRKAVMHYQLLCDSEALNVQLHMSEARFRSLAEMLPETVFETDDTGNVTFLNQAGMERFGITHEMINAGFHITQGVTPKDRDSAQVAFQRVLDGGIVSGFEIEACHQSGETFPILSSATPIRNGNVVNGVRAIVVDITKQKEVEQELRLYQETLRAMDAELQMAEERARCKLAQDLHDSVAQLLAAARMQIGLCAKCRDMDAWPKLLDDASNIIKEALQQTRSLVFQLSPPSLYSDGFQAALEDLASHMLPVYGLNVKFHDCEDPVNLEEPIRIQVFRAVRELLINVSKHSGKRECAVSLEQKGNMLIVTVEDHGAGFDVSDTNANQDGGGFGLFGVRERLKNIEGSLQIASAPGKGTKAIIRAPISTDEVEMLDGDV